MFLLIFSSNLDEFFEIRVSGLKKRLQFDMRKPDPDGKYPEQILQQIHEQVRTALNEQYRILNEDLFPSLAAENIHFVKRQDWSGKLAKWAREYFDNEVLPVVSPLGLDPAHPFPRLVNKRLNFVLSLEGKDAFGRESGLAIVPAPRSLPRLIKVPEEIAPEGDNFVFLSSIIHAYVGEFFPGMEVTACHQFRVTRNADLEMSNVEIEDVATALQNKLHSRRFGAATKLEVDSGLPRTPVEFPARPIRAYPQRTVRTRRPGQPAKTGGAFRHARPARPALSQFFSRRAAVAGELPHARFQRGKQGRPVAAASVPVLSADHPMGAGSRQGSRGIVDQADLVSHQRIVRTRGSAGRGRAQRQGGHRGDRIARALRRRREHPFRQHSAGSRRRGGLWRARLQDPRQDAAFRAARKRPAEALRASRHRQLPSQELAGLHRLQPADRGRDDLRRRAQGFPADHRHGQEDSAEVADPRAFQAAQGPAQDDRQRKARGQGRKARPDQGEDEFADRSPRSSRRCIQPPARE